MVAQTGRHPPPSILLQVREQTARTIHPPPGEGAGADNGAALGRANRGGELGVRGPMGEIKEAAEGSGVLGRQQ